MIHILVIFLDDSEENHEGPIDIEWQNASIFVKFHKNFYDATLNLRASTRHPIDIHIICIVLKLSG